MAECNCHRGYPESNHEGCCGHDEGRNPDCPFHGDGSGPGAIHTPIYRDLAHFDEVMSGPTPQELREAAATIIALNAKRGDPGRRWEPYGLIDEATRIEESRI